MKTLFIVVLYLAMVYVFARLIVWFERRTGGDEKEALVALAWIWPALLVLWPFFLWELITNGPKK